MYQSVMTMLSGRARYKHAIHPDGFARARRSDPKLSARGCSSAVSSATATGGPAYREDVDKISLRLDCYFFAFLRAEPDFAAGFFLTETLLLTAFLMAALGDGLEVEPDRSSSTAAPAAWGKVSSPFKALATCSLPAAIVFETIRLSVPSFLAIWFP